MHGKLRESIKRRASARENIGVLVAGLLFLAALVLADRAGMPRKWHTAIYATAGPFGTVIVFSPSYWRRWTFWLTIAVCLAVHALAIYALFEHVFPANAYPGILIWTPIAFVETFAVLVAVLRVERRLKHKKEGDVAS
jgi:hypothetical protein